MTETVEKSPARPKPNARHDRRESVRSSAPTRFLTYNSSHYAVEVPDDWVLEEAEVDHGGFVRTLWRDPSDAEASILIDVVDGETTPAEQKAASVMGATSQSVGYRELSSGSITVAGLDGYRWTFTVDGDRRVDYFVNDCTTGIAILGSAPPSRFQALEATFDRVANSIAVRCAPVPVEPEPPSETCHPSYEGACLNAGAYDYDCDSGTGNGPDYTGRVEVVGPDDFDLDRDGDGIGCDR